MFDLIIKNGKIFDGTGNDWFKFDIGILNDKIEFIGNLNKTDGESLIDAKGKIVSPGFIDIHSHSDLSAMLYPTADSKVLQGVTTEVVGNCGSSPAPVKKENLELIKDYIGNEISDKLPWNWRTMDDFYQEVEKIGSSVNFVPLVGHGTLRVAVMGYENREPTDNELKEMKSLLEQEMKSGYFGISTGLEYAPGSYSKTEEIIELARVVSKYGGIYATHIRNEGSGVVDAINEAITISKEAGTPLEISHLKVVGKENWDRDDKILKLIYDARKNGIEVNADVYPYTASHTTLTIMLPSWVLEGGVRNALSKLQDHQLKEKIRYEILRKGPDWERITIPSYNGKSIKELSVEWNIDPFETFVKLLLDNNGSVSIIGHSMREESVEKFILSPLVSIGSDSSGRKPGEGPLGGLTHPRAYGTFPRVISGYWREKNLISLSEAIRKMTGLSAAKLRLKERGLIKEGYYADLVIFDPEKISDLATFNDPIKFPAGIDYVIVNGVIVAERGKHTNKKPGRIIKKIKIK
ncbi:MAG: N-acyl-D-amino-acid deacylase family protein [Thermoplasmata archaeon]|jgi:N-acyl-D-amino-acid deacylase